MPDRVLCSECGGEYASRGFGSHNAAMHNGEADPQPVETDGGDVETDDDGNDGGLQARDRPDGFDPFGSGGDESDAGKPEDTEGVEDAFGDDGNEVSGEADAGQVSDDVEDTEDDARDYNCGNCGHGLEYLGGADRDGGGKACPECGERLLWSRVEP